MKRTLLKNIFANHWVALVAIFLCAFALRVAYLQMRGAWYDEAFAVLYASRSLEEIAAGTLTQVAGAAADVHPLFYYFSLHAWLQIAGDSIFVARFYSVGFGLATLAIVYKLARELFGKPAAILSALVLAFAPFHIAYSQEARMYAQLGFFSALALYSFVRLQDKLRFTTKTPNHEGHQEKNNLGVLGVVVSWWWMVFVLAGAGALYSHNLAFIALGALGVWVMIDAVRTRMPRVLIATVIAGAAMFLLWLPWLVVVPSQFSKIEQAYWVPTPTIATLVQTLLVFTFDFDNAAHPSALVPFLLFLSIILPALAAIELRRAPDRRPAIFVAALTILPVALLYLLSQVRPLYIIRGLMPAFLCYVIFIAWMLARLPRALRYVSFVLLGAALAALLPAYYSYAVFPRSPFQATDKFLRAQSQPGDAIVHDNKLSFFPAHLYDRALAQSFIADPAGAGSDTLALPTQRALGLEAVTFDAATANASRVWFVIYQPALDQAQEEGRVHSNKNWMDTHFKLVSLTRFNDLNVYLYQK